MKPFSTPRQPFVGLALIAATGIIVAEVVPVAPATLISATLVIGICILITLCWPNLAATYLIVAAGFFCCTNLQQRTLQASNSRTNLASGRAVS
jgi:hypothetical protein